MSIEVAAAGLAAAGVATFCAGLAHTLRWQFLDQRIRGYVTKDHGAAARREPSRRAALRGSPFAPGLHRRLTRSSLGSAVQSRVVRAGLGLRPSEFILLQTAAAGAGGVAGALAPLGAGVGFRLLAALVLAVVGFVGPLVALGCLERRRQAAFERQLPQAVDAMAGTLQAGSTLPQAMEIIARELRPPLSVEFRRVLRETELGLAFNDSLANLLARVPSADLLLLTSAIAIQYRVGGDLAAIFRSISHTIRERLRIRSEIKVLTAQARYSAYIIALLPVVLFGFLWTTNYAYLAQLFLPGLTRLLLVGGVTGIVVGFAAMNRIANIEV